ncbi:VanZ family protein [Mariniflexile soesokkakense]|uniref:VanZ family protein n=1 Tax=Mariniflexile soesokkakense TaxID=1343160 RepID=A0ABV0ADC9_9FLAO
MLKKGVLFVSILYTVLLGTVCLIKINKLPNVGVSFGDKIFHFLAYTVLAFLWFNTFFSTFKFGKKKALIYAALFSIVFGIVIEVLQGTITTSRSSDFYDVIANTMGVFFTVIIVFIKNLITIKKQ